MAPASQSAGSTLPPARSAGIKGWLKWLSYLAVGAVAATPLTLRMLLQVVTNPWKMLYRKDRRSLVFPDPLPGLSHEWIETEPGVKLHAVRTSSGSGKPLMLTVHGFPEAWFSWRHQMAAFRDEYEIVAIDMRGYGDSSKPQGRAPYRMDKLVGDITTVIQHLLREAKQDKLVLVAHDWGANICWAVAALYPHLLRRLAIMCVPHPRCYFANMDWDQLARSWYVWAFQLPFLGEFALTAADYQMVEDALTKPPMGCSTPGAISPEDIERYKQAIGQPGAATAAINYYRGAIDMGSRYPLPYIQKALRGKISVPTLLIWGENDVALGQQLLRGTEKYVDRLRVEVLAGSSHWVQQDRPREVNRLLADFLGAAQPKL